MHWSQDSVCGEANPQQCVNGREVPLSIFSETLVKFSCPEGSG